MRGNAGFALKNRDVVSVYKHPECKIKALEVVMPEAVKRGEEGWIALIEVYLPCMQNLDSHPLQK